MKTFRRELISLINKHSKENGSNTPDFILAEYLLECLHTFDKITNMRNEWYGEKLIESKIHESRNEFEKEIDEKYPKLFEDIDFEKMASDMNYHNECARATLYPGVAIEDIPKVTADELRVQLIKGNEVQDKNGEIIFNDNLDGKSVTDEELEALANWLKSDEGKRKIQEAIENSNVVCEAIEKMRDIDPAKLREPFNI